MIETTISGIPCQIEVDSLLVDPPWRGPAHKCPSSDDFYGYHEIEFTVYDRKSCPAEWLQRKMTEKDIERIELEILINNQRQEN